MSMRRQQPSARRVASRAVAAATTAAATARRRRLAKRESRAVRVGGRRILVNDEKHGLAQDILGVPARLETPQHLLQNGAGLEYEGDGDDDRAISEEILLGEDRGDEIGKRRRQQGLERCASEEKDEFGHQSRVAHAAGLIPHFRSRAPNVAGEKRAKPKRARESVNAGHEASSRHSGHIAEAGRSHEDSERKRPSPIPLHEFVRAKRERLKQRTVNRLAKESHDKREERERQKEQDAAERDAKARQERARRAAVLERGAAYLAQQAKRDEDAQRRRRDEAREIAIFCKRALAAKAAEEEVQRAQLQAWRKRREDREKNFLAGVVLPKEYPKPDAETDPALYGCDVLTRHLGFSPAKAIFGAHSVPSSS